MVFKCNLNNSLPQIDTINEIANEQDDALDKCHFKNVIEYAEEYKIIIIYIIYEIDTS